MSRIVMATANNEHKDRLFRYIFGASENKKFLLSLCNAVGGTNYKNPEDIEITTLTDVLYIRMKNDISFLIGCEMNLYEHQSTFNPNMPLRGLQYFAELYTAYIKENRISIYSSSLKKIPTPRYVVFYNGTVEQPDIVKLKLSDAFQVPDNTGEFEWTATMLNINYGHNKELMEKCKPLKEYAEFIRDVRDYSQQMSLKDAVDVAIKGAEKWSCIGNFLSRSRSEVNAMLLTEFDQRAYEEDLIKQSKLDNQVIMVKNLIESTIWTPKKAMDNLNISEEARSHILARLEKK